MASAAASTLLRGRRPEDTGVYAKWAQGAAGAVAGVEAAIVYGFLSVAEAMAFTVGAGLSVVDRRRRGRLP